ncbi:MAG: YCF48-related protein [Desulfobacterales bacterium]|jgi:photosystem II stability/assembly factor-like uncharacterized protein|nr:YCF48-related protein [Desulfobacterales bacterium]
MNSHWDLADAKPGRIPAKSLSYNFYDICRVDDQNFWVCGKSGLLYRTQDAGLTWERMRIGADQSLFGVVFLSETRGIIVGQEGLVMATDDAGKTWEKVNTPADQALLTLDFYDDRHGMAAGDWGKIIATNDGGKTWRNVSLEEDILLYCIKLTGPEEAWMATEMGRIYHTTDGGKTWDKQALAYGTLTAIDFDNCGNGVAVGIEGLVLRTTDGGKTWESSTITKESLYNIRFNDRIALIVGDAGTIFYQVPEPKKECPIGGVWIGDNWKPIKVPVELRANWLQCIELKGPQQFIIGGARGSISYVHGTTLIWPGAGE